MDQVKTLHSSSQYFSSLLVQAKIPPPSLSIIMFSTAYAIPSLPLQCGPEATPVLSPCAVFALEDGGLCVLGVSWLLAHLQTLCQLKYITALLKEA